MVSCELGKNLGIAGKWDDCQQEEEEVVVRKKGKWEGEVEWGTANARNQLVKVGKKQSSLDAFLQPTQAQAQAVPETGVRLLPLLNIAIPLLLLLLLLVHRQVYAYFGCRFCRHVASPCVASRRIVRWL